MEALLGALDPADALPYALAVYATARRAEIRHARVEDVDLDLGVIYLGAEGRVFFQPAFEHFAGIQPQRARVDNGQVGLDVAFEIIDRNAERQRGLGLMDANAVTAMRRRLPELTEGSVPGTIRSGASVSIPL